MDSPELLITARWIVPVEPAGQVLDQHALLIREGRIADLLPVAEAADRYPGTRRLDRPSHLLVPGLVNAHVHMPMTLFRGLADDLPLQTWLEEHIWPAEQRWVGAEFVRDGSELAALEMIRGGTTCCQEMYFFPDVAAEAALVHGLRVMVGMIVIEQATPWASTVEEYFEKGLAVHDRFKGNELIRTSFAPHAPYTVGDEALARVRLLADELECPVHMHVHETAFEVASAVETGGERPLARLDRLGLVSPLLAAVHMTQLDDNEIRRVADAGASVVHCPESNLKLASGFCPVARLQEAGINVALGTDGASSNNDLDMFSEMRSAALLGKAVAGDAAAVSAETALSMATLNGARAIGMGDEIGSLEVGKRADLLCIDLDHPATQPVHHPISQLVYAASREQVSDVWIGGEHLLNEGEFTRARAADVTERARGWQRRLEAHT
jgi:5-methylthioadenosine/S-adenosylhomocysteine deaminase